MGLKSHEKQTSKSTSNTSGSIATARQIDMSYKHWVIDLIPISLKTLTTVTIPRYCDSPSLDHFRWLDIKQIRLIIFASTGQYFEILRFLLDYLHWKS